MSGADCKTEVRTGVTVIGLQWRNPKQRGYKARGCTTNKGGGGKVRRERKIAAPTNKAKKKQSETLVATYKEERKGTSGGSKQYRIKQSDEEGKKARNVRGKENESSEMKKTLRSLKNDRRAKEHGEELETVGSNNADKREYPPEISSERRKDRTRLLQKTASREQRHQTRIWRGRSPGKEERILKTGTLHRKRRRTGGTFKCEGTAWVTGEEVKGYRSRNKKSQQDYLKNRRQTTRRKECLILRGKKSKSLMFTRKGGKMLKRKQKDEVID